MKQRKERNLFKTIQRATGRVVEIETYHIFTATFVLLKLFEIIFRTLDSLWQTPNPFTCTVI